MGGHNKKRAAQPAPVDEYEQLMRQGKWEKFARLAISRLDQNVNGIITHTPEGRHAAIRLEENAVFMAPALLDLLDAARSESFFARYPDAEA